jgi:CRP/FNR family transcriptional regulator, cyclic AMP receptor protein
VVTGLDQLPELAASSRVRHVAAGQAVFAVGEAIEVAHVVRSGAVFVRSTTLDGDPAVVDVRARGDLLDDSALLGTGPLLHLDQAVALTDCEILQLPMREFERLRDTSPEFGAMLVTRLTDQARRLSNGLVDLLGRPVRVRTARRLLDLAEALDRSGLTGSPITMTQGDLAEFAGTTRPTLNATLGEFESAQAISRGRGSLTIVARGALLRFI